MIKYIRSGCRGPDSMGMEGAPKFSLSQLRSIERSPNELRLHFELFMRGVLCPAVSYTAHFGSPTPAMIASLEAMVPLGLLPMGVIDETEVPVAPRRPPIKGANQPPEEGRETRPRSAALEELGRTELQVVTEDTGAAADALTVTPSVPNSHAFWIRSLVKLIQRQLKSALNDIQCRPDQSSLLNKEDALTNPTMVMALSKISMSQIAAHPTLPVVAGCASLEALGRLLVMPAQVARDGEPNLLDPMDILGFIWKSGDIHTVPLRILALPAAEGEVALSASPGAPNRDCQATSSIAWIPPPPATLPAPRVSRMGMGRVHSLGWSSRGDRLVAAFSKGYLGIWSAYTVVGLPPGSRCERVHCIVEGSVSASTSIDEEAPEGSRPPRYRRSSTDECLWTPVVRPTLFFRAHESGCFAACFLSPSRAGSRLLVTAGKGVCRESWGAMDIRSPKMAKKKRPDVVDPVPCASDGCICVWDLLPRGLNRPALILCDAGFERGSFPVKLAAWPAKQVVFAGGARGEVRVLDLRYHRAATLIGASHGHAPQNGQLQMLVCAETQQLIIVYEDAMARAWELKEFVRELSKFPAGDHWAPPPLKLVWETEAPLHTPPDGRASIKTALGSVMSLSRQPTGPAVVEAHLLSAGHLLTVGHDHALVMTRF
eukprot:Polyplicarium_translucidae@DN2224_c0_g1_i6.p1